MLQISSIPFELQRARPLRRGAIERLRSVTFVADGLDVKQTRELLEGAAPWLGRFNDWFGNVVGIPEARGLHLLYDRDVTVTGAAVLDCLPALRELGRHARAMGYGFSLSLTRADLNRGLERVLSLAEEKVVTAVAFHLDEVDDGGEGPWRDAIERTLGAHVNVGIIGTYGTFGGQSLLTSPAISRSDLTWYPVKPENVRASPREPVRHCHSRLRLYVDGAGTIYPCFGLIGKSEGVLGSIFEPIEDSALAQPGVLDLLDQWEREGPAAAELGIVSDDEDEDVELPAICRRHRRGLI